MNDDLLSRLKKANKGLTEPYNIPFTSPNGRHGYRCYNEAMGHYEIHICETQEDVIARNEGRW